MKNGSAPAATEPDVRSPLSGVLVVDLSRHLPGPYAARMLANLGARVVKVEEPELGDPVRAAPPFSGGRSRLAASLLGGIESVALDLGAEGGAEVLASLLERADVLIETFRPGRLARFGFGPEDLRVSYPRLIVCSLSGWGQNGPAAGRSGHDLTYQAASGTLASSGAAPALPSADIFGAWSAVASINAALFDRERRGEGTWIDASLFDAAVAANATNIADSGESEDAEGAPPFPGSLSGALPCYRLYRARDGGLVALAALEPKFWRAFCLAAGRPDLRRLQYSRDPASHRRVAGLISERAADEWQALFVEHDFPGETVVSALEALSAPQAAARGLDRVGRDGVPFPVLLDGWRPRAEGELPRVGEHTRAILAEFCPRWQGRSRQSRVTAGIGPRLSLKRAFRSFWGSLKR